MRKYLVGAAMAIVLVTNGIALIKIASDRASLPVQTIELTERELTLEDTGNDSSAVILHLRYSRPGNGLGPGYLEQAKLEAIGFDFRCPPGTPGRDRSLLLRDAFAVLEYNGPSFQTWLKTAQNDTNRRFPFSVDPGSASRLVPVDIGAKYADLRAQYPDQSRHLIVSAVIRASIQDDWDPGHSIIVSHHGTGLVQEISPFLISVPLPHNRALLQLKDVKIPRYTVKLSYNRNLEPQVASVSVR
jgi:hypothetical protein